MYGVIEPKDERWRVDAIDLSLQRPREDGFQFLRSDSRKKNRLTETLSLVCFLCTPAVSLSCKWAKKTRKTPTFSHLIHVENINYTRKTHFSLAFVNTRSLMLFQLLPSASSFCFSVQWLKQAQQWLAFIQ